MLDFRRGIAASQTGAVVSAAAAVVRGVRTVATGCAVGVARTYGTGYHSRIHMGWIPSDKRTMELRLSEHGSARTDNFSGVTVRTADEVSSSKRYHPTLKLFVTHSLRWGCQPSYMFSSRGRAAAMAWCWISCKCHGGDDYFKLRDRIEKENESNANYNT